METQLNVMTKKVQPGLEPLATATGGAAAFISYYFYFSARAETD